MFNLIKHTIVVAVAAAAVMVSSAAAYARVDLNPLHPAAAAAQRQASLNAAGLRYAALAAAAQRQEQPLATSVAHPSPSAGSPSATSPNGFQWGDAGIGAVGMLVIVGLGSAAVATRRRTRPVTG
jgi:hypothetical protein